MTELSTLVTMTITTNEKETNMRAIKWCGQCHKKAVFTHHDTGWCSTVLLMGGLNHLGYCIKKKVDSPELTAYEQQFKGEL